TRTVQLQLSTLFSSPKTHNHRLCAMRAKTRQSTPEVHMARIAAPVVGFSCPSLLLRASASCTCFANHKSCPQSLCSLTLSKPSGECRHCTSLLSLLIRVDYGQLDHNGLLLRY